MKFITLFLFFNLFAFSLYAKENPPKIKHKTISSKIMELDWKKVPFENTPYSLFSKPGGAQVFTLPDKNTLQFEIHLVFPLSYYSLPLEDLPSFFALSDQFTSAGFGDLPSEELDKILSDNGIHLSSKVNNFGRIEISAEGLSSDFPVVIGMFKKMIFQLHLKEESLKLYQKEKSDEYEELLEANTSEKQEEFMNDVVAQIVLGKQNKYSQTTDLHVALEAKNAKLEKVKELYHEVINQNGLQIGLIGNYSDEDFRSLSQLMSEIPSQATRGEIWLPERINNENSNAVAVVLRKKNMSQNTISLRYFFPNLGALNKIEKTQYELISRIFSTSGDVMGNDRFTNAMRVQSNISYEPFAYFIPDWSTPNTNSHAFYLNFQASNERLLEGIHLAHETWDNFVHNGIQDEELNKARSAMMNQLLASESSIFTRGNDLLNEIQEGLLPSTLPVLSKLSAYDTLRNKEDINFILKNLSIKPKKTVMVIMGNPDQNAIDALSKINWLNEVKVIDFDSLSDL